MDGSEKFRRTRAGMMKRLLRTAFGVLGLLLVSAHAPASAQNLLYKLVDAAKGEMAKKSGKLRVALDWPEADTKNVLPEFKRSFPFIREILYVREGDVGPFANYLIRIKRGEYPDFDIMHIAGEFEAQYEKEGVFVKPPFDYKNLNGYLPQGWPKLDPRTLDPDGYFIGTTGNARGIVWNPGLIPKGKEPTSWDACADPIWKGKFLVDTRNRLQSLQHDPKTREKHPKWLRMVAGNNPVITQGQNAMIEKVASGE